MRMKLALSAAGLILAAAGSGLRAQPVLSGPGSGYAFAAGGFRPILGIPGAAYLGSRIPGTELFASVAPNGVSAITFGESGVRFTAGLGETEPVPLEDAIAPAIVHWAADSGAAALYSRDAQAIQFSTSLASAPRMGIPIRMDELGVTGAPLAVDAGARLAAVCTGEGLGILGMAGLMRTQVSCEGFSTGAFHGSTALYLAGSGQIVEIRDWENGGQTRTLPGNDLSQPVAAAVWTGADAILFIVADASANRLHVFDAGAGNELERFDLDSTPSSLDAIGKQAFLLNRDRAVSAPLLVFQLAPQHAVQFIPAGE